MIRVNGRRGVFLLLFGVIYIAIGASYIDPEPGAAVVHAMAWMPPWAALWACGLLWCVAGVTAAAAAFRPLPEDRFGFEALAAIAWGWAVAYTVSWVLHDAHRGWVSALIFLIIGIAVLVVSGMPNPGKIRGAR